MRHLLGLYISSTLCTVSSIPHPLLLYQYHHQVIFPHIPLGANTIITISTCQSSSNSSHMSALWDFAQLTRPENLEAASVPADHVASIQSYMDRLRVRADQCQRNIATLPTIDSFHDIWEVAFDTMKNHLTSRRNNFWTTSTRRREPLPSGETRIQRRPSLHRCGRAYVHPVKRLRLCARR
ncbi:hypothetical protein FA95DRAFT_503422 [Auriscalpium vulgare]|uniref:Uncharacterized protein n=1 Tax=Auriscalpium vulgare TaxID=40419 RepID=A0ACB8RHA3_9AGAM|nr:hypothetical protein FA95DRAFT_503422 [Auriscalpium vulgare]